jgi:hypothetical protein
MFGLFQHHHPGIILFLILLSVLGVASDFAAVVFVLLALAALDVLMVFLLDPVVVLAVLISSLVRTIFALFLLLVMLLLPLRLPLPLPIVYLSEIQDFVTQLTITANQVTIVIPDQDVSWS